MKKRQESTFAIVRQIKTAALNYKTNLVGRTFLYVFDDRYIEVIFKSSSFKHLTGVDSHLSADMFYRAAFKNKLSISDVQFNKEHPYKNCVRKIKHINDLASLVLGECFMLENITTKTHTFQFGTTDMNFSLLFDSDVDSFGNLKSEKYIVKSLRDEDCFNKSKNAYVVTHILSKSNDAKLYDKIVYIDSNANQNLPLEVSNKLHPDLISIKKS